MFKAILFILALLIFYGLYAPPSDPRWPQAFYPLDPVDLNSLNVSLDKLNGAQYFCDSENLKNPEDLIADDDGNMYVGLADGSIVKITPEGKHNVIGRGNGLILGLTWSNNKDQFYFADQLSGIGSFNIQTNQLKTIVSIINFPELTSPNAITVGQDGLIYFTDSGKILISEFHKQLLQGHPDGRVYVFDPKTQNLEMLARGLYFANGIAHNNNPDPTQECVFVAETSHYKVLKIYTKGDKKGQSEVLVENLPGFPDNMRLSDDGSLWVATPALRNKITNLINEFPAIRRMASNLNIPGSMILMFCKLSYAGGVRIDPSKKEIVEYFYGKPEKMNFVTGITEHKGKIYLSSLLEPCVAVLTKN